MSGRSMIIASLACCLLAAAGGTTADARAADSGPPPAAQGPVEMIVRFAAPPTERMIADVEAVLGVVSWRVPRHAPHAKGDAAQPHPLSFFRIAGLAPEADVLGLSGNVTALPFVTLATTNNRPEPSGFPNDPLFEQQWSHTKINTLAGWAIATGEASVIVGVIDTGCRVSHEDLAANVWINDDPVNGLDDDENGFIDDTYGWDFSRDVNDITDVFGHGTQAAGIVGAEIDNGLGVAGIADVTLMVAKWWHTSGSDSSVAEAVSYAVDNGAHVLNLSLSCGCLMPMSEVAVQYALANDVVVVCSAGNGGSTNLHYPAAYPETMAVSAINQNDQLPGFSSFGDHLDVAAPSPDILTCEDTGDADYDPGFRGTSAAAPHVAGLAALVRSVNPALTAEEVRAAINANATDVGAPGFDIEFGNGRIDVGATIAAVVPDESCVADLDGSGGVDFSDLLSLLSTWGPCPGCPEDIDGDGAVGFTDLVTLLSYWGPCPA